jgi:hypothetical protein
MKASMTQKRAAIGKRFQAWDGFIYVCDSVDQNGLWMTREDAPEANKTDRHSIWRRNVSEHVVGRTFHLIHEE